MAIQKFIGKVSQNECLGATSNFYTKIELINPHRINFIAGQYVLLTVPGDVRKRQYSIASSPKSDYQIDLLVDVKPHGIGTSYIEQLKPGDEVEFLGPAGAFVLSEASSESELVFIATGSGISPLRSMILHQLQDLDDSRQIKLLWGLRSVEDIYWEEEWQLLAEAYPNFSHHIALSKPPEGWPLVSGRVTDILSTMNLSGSQTGFYVCGNPDMIESVKQILFSKNISRDKIHFEKFF